MAAGEVSEASAVCVWAGGQVGGWAGELVGEGGGYSQARALCIGCCPTNSTTPVCSLRMAACSCSPWWRTALRMMGEVSSCSMV
jgi:hypothetical protein